MAWYSGSWLMQKACSERAGKPQISPVRLEVAWQRTGRALQRGQEGHSLQGQFSGSSQKSASGDWPLAVGSSPSPE
jgi:hypothetical protein